MIIYIDLAENVSRFDVLINHGILVEKMERVEDIFKINLIVCTNLMVQVSRV